jgi:hypothetical protein
MSDAQFVVWVVCAAGIVWSVTPTGAVRRAVTRIVRRRAVRLAEYRKWPV